MSTTIESSIRAAVMALSMGADDVACQAQAIQALATEQPTPEVTKSLRLGVVQLCSTAGDVARLLGQLESLRWLRESADAP